MSFARHIRGFLTGRREPAPADEGAWAERLPVSADEALDALAWSDTDSGATLERRARAVRRPPEPAAPDVAREAR